MLAGGPLFMGIDPSFTGLAVVVINEKGVPVEARTFSAPLPKLAKGQKRDKGEARRLLLERAEKLAQAVANAVQLWGPVSIGMEDLVNLGTNQRAAKELAYLCGVIEHWLRGREVTPVNPLALKRFVAGKVKGIDKAAIKLAVFKRWGVEFPDDNQTDAYGLAQLEKARWQKMAA